MAKKATHGERLSKRNLWSYSLAGIGRDMGGSFFGSYLMTYVLFTKSLDPKQFAAIGMIMVAAKVFDAINDPIMGNILEVTRTRWGKFKPWITAGMISSAVVFYISFANSLQGWSYVALFGVLYFSYSITFTMNDIAYWGMVPSLAQNAQDRDTLTSRAVLLAGVGQAVTTLVVPTFTAGDMVIGGNAITAYAVIAGVISVCFMAFQCITLFGVVEKPLPPKTEASVSRVGFGTIAKVLRNNDQISWSILIFLLHAVSNGLINGGLSVTYVYFTYGYKGILLTLFSALGALATAVVMVFYAPISKKIPRATMMRVATISAVCGYLFMLLVGLFVPAGDTWVLKFALTIVGNLFAFLGQSVYYLVMIICIANTVEYNEWKSGTRAEGIIFAVRPFITKLASAIVQFLIMIIYLVIGVKDITNDISDIENLAASGAIQAEEKASQIASILTNVPDSKSAALLLCMTLIPIVLIIASYYFYQKKYIITEEKYEDILADLEARKQSEKG